MTSSNSHSTERYLSYVVRFWQSGPDGQWRASVCCIRSGETLRFADVASCLAFLQEQTLVTSNRQPPDGHAEATGPA
jgi:hypothetical protein